MPRTRLGEYLVERGLLRPTELSFALAHQRRTGERLGRILLTLGYVGRSDLYAVLAERWRMPFIHLTPAEVDGDLTRKFPIDDAVRFRAIPFRREGETLLVAVADPPTDDLAAILRQYYGHCRIGWRATTDWDVDQAAATAYGNQMVDRGVSQLYYREPEESAFRALTAGQKVALGGVGLLVAILLWERPLATLQILNLAVTLLLLAVALYRVVAGVYGRRVTAAPAPARDVAPRSPPIWPTYTILLPIFRDDQGVEEAIAYLTALDYPRDRLEILVLVDEEDAAARAHLAERHPGLVHILALPQRRPRTKPRMCNVGLFYARGDFLVIYDVEDRPERDQLKRAVLAHHQAGNTVLAVMGTLAYRNAANGLLAKLTAREDTIWFESVLPGMVALELPAPLPAASCHFRIDKLRDLGGWDPYNAAADTDLGMRASMAGMRLAPYESQTSEMVVERLQGWLLQRARWLRGYIQTVLVHARNPFDLGRRAQRRQVAAFLLYILGTPLAFLLLPASLLFSVVSLSVPSAFPVPFLGVAAALVLAVAGGLSTFVLLLPVRQRGVPRVGLAGLLYPLYWMLHALPALLAFYQVFWRSVRAVDDRAPTPMTPDPD